MTAIPLFESSVSAGFPCPAETSIDQTLDLNALLVTHPAATFFVRVQGNSMEGANIFSGDILIVDRSLEAVHGKVVVAILGGEFTVKRLHKRREKISLVAEHPDYKPIEISTASDFQVWGVVTHVIHQMR
ncbi:MAG: translesion error-prone DNA polymerase V autoproteolytic subunit [Chlamydiales bacterium]|nr:translesion error-prone DNA polymerase V autoproteolytic subunit [Chlamydiales bacterium]